MSSKNSNKLNIPEAKAAMNKFKMEAASEVGVNLKRLQRRSDLPRGRLCRRPDGQEDDRELREEPVKKALSQIADKGRGQQAVPFLL